MGGTGRKRSWVQAHASRFKFGKLGALLVRGAGVYARKGRLYSLQSTGYSLQSTVYSLQSTVYGLRRQACVNGGIAGCCVGRVDDDGWADAWVGVWVGRWGRRWGRAVVGVWYVCGGGGGVWGGVGRGAGRGVYMWCGVWCRSFQTHHLRGGGLRIHTSNTYYFPSRCRPARDTQHRTTHRRTHVGICDLRFAIYDLRFTIYEDARTHGLKYSRLSASDTHATTPHRGCTTTTHTGRPRASGGPLAKTCNL